MATNDFYRMLLQSKALSSDSATLNTDELLEFNARLNLALLRGSRFPTTTDTGGWLQLYNEHTKVLNAATREGGQTVEAIQTTTMDSAQEVDAVVPFSDSKSISPSRRSETKKDFWVGAKSEVLSRLLYDASGLQSSIGTDFKEYRRIVASRPSMPLAEILSTRHEGQIWKDGFWICAYDERGDLAATQAHVILELDVRPLSNFMQANFDVFRPPLEGVLTSQSRFRATPGTRIIEGKVDFVTDFWVTRGEANKFLRATPMLGHIGMAEVLARYGIDWIFAQILNVVAFKGLAARMGFLHLEPHVSKWMIEGREQPIDGFLAYNNRDDINYLLEIVPVNDEKLNTLGIVA